MPNQGAYEVQLHPSVTAFLDGLMEEQRKRCVQSLRKLGEYPYKPRPKTDIKKLKGKKEEMYRLRVGEFRFEYFVEKNKVYIVAGFRRGRGYR